MLDDSWDGLHLDQPSRVFGRMKRAKLRLCWRIPINYLRDGAGNRNSLQRRKKWISSLLHRPVELIASLAREWSCIGKPPSCYYRLKLISTNIEQGGDSDQIAIWTGQCCILASLVQLAYEKLKESMLSFCRYSRQFFNNGAFGWGSVAIANMIVGIAVKSA